VFITTMARPGTEAKAGDLPVSCGSGKVAQLRFIPRANGVNVDPKLMPDRSAISCAAIAVGGVDFS
jgi:hypothetical protein